MRQKVPQFPYDELGTLNCPNLEQICGKEVVWHDKRFPADDDAIFDRRITVK